MYELSFGFIPQPRDISDDQLIAPIELITLESDRPISSATKQRWLLAVFFS